MSASPHHSPATRYPLFLGELVKSTEDHEDGHAELIQAARVMTRVAERINDIKALNEMQE